MLKLAITIMSNPFSILGYPDSRFNAGFLEQFIDVLNSCGVNKISLDFLMFNRVQPLHLEKYHKDSDGYWISQFVKCNKVVLKTTNVNWDYYDLIIAQIDIPRWLLDRLLNYSHKVVWLGSESDELNFEKYPFGKLLGDKGSMVLTTSMNSPNSDYVFFGSIPLTTDILVKNDKQYDVFYVHTKDNKKYEFIKNKCCTVANFGCKTTNPGRHKLIQMLSYCKTICPGFREYKTDRFTSKLWEAYLSHSTVMFCCENKERFISSCLDKFGVDIPDYYLLEYDDYDNYLDIVKCIFDKQDEYFDFSSIIIQKMKEYNISAIYKIIEKYKLTNH